MLAEVAAADARRRAQLIVGWELSTLDQMEGDMREAASRGDDVEEQLAAIARERSRVEEYARRAGVGTRRWRVDEKQLAATHRRDGYLDFLITHHFVHGSTFAGAQRYRQAGDVVYVRGPAADTETWGRSATLFAASSLVEATRSICTIMRWTEPEDLNGLLQRIEDADDS